MSKYVKNLISSDIHKRLEGVSDAILVNVIGMDSGSTFNIRKQLREKNISMLVVKRSMASRATEGTSLRPMFDNRDGSMAIVWGSEDFVSLAKEIAAIDKSRTFEKFEIKGGVMDSDALSAEQVLAISKWPSRVEQISILIGQLLSPGSGLSSQLLASGGKLASQLEKLVEKLEGSAADTPAEKEEATPS
ncbi:MAG: 50S ribosomal protein L10 [Aureliella sp.]